MYAILSNTKLGSKFAKFFAAVLFACVVSTSARASFCESLLDHLIQDVSISIEATEHFNSFKEAKCRQYQKYKDSNIDFSTIVDGFSFIGNHSDVRSTLDAWCSNTNISSASKETKINYVSMLNSSFGRAIEKCSDQQQRNAVFISKIITSADGKVFTVEITFNRNSTVLGITKRGVENCVVEGFVEGENFEIGDQSRYGYVICDRSEGDDDIVFGSALLQLRTTDGLLEAIDLPQVKKFKIVESKKYYWLRDTLKRQTFTIGGRCNRTAQERHVCDAGSEGVSWSQLARPSASLPLRKDGGNQGINFSLSGDRRLLTVNGGASCDNQRSTTEDGYAYICTKETTYEIQ